MRCCGNCDYCKKDCGKATDIWNDGDHNRLHTECHLRVVITIWEVSP